MTAHGFDDRLSAFYDGELSAAERSEVERLIVERPELQAELSVLAGLSQQLTDLSENVPEVDLRPRIMQRIQASRPAAQPLLAHPRRRWMPLLLTICSLSLLVAAVLPLLPLSNDAHTVTINDASTPTLEELKKAMNVAAASPRSGHMPEEGIGLHDSPATSPAVAATALEMSKGGLGGGANLATKVTDLSGTGPSEFLASIEQRRDLKPGDIVSRMVEGGDVPMIAEYTVVDVRRSAHDVEILLQEHGIVPLAPAEKAEGSKSIARSAKANSVSDMKVYLVDAESQSLNTALFACQNLAEVVALNVEPMVPQPEEDTPASALASRTPAGDKAAPPPVPAAVQPFAPSAATDHDGNRRNSGLPTDRDESGSGLKDQQSGERFPPSKASSPVEGIVLNTPLNMDTTNHSDEKFKQLVNGNSLIVENGNELYTEIMQRQVQALKNGERAHPAKQAPGSESQGFSRIAPNSTGSAFGQNTASSANGMLQGDGLQYGNSAYSHRSRQRAILVLRAQSPPPPPEATRSKASNQ